MTEDEGHGFRRIVQDQSRGLVRPGYHDNRQPQLPRGDDLGERRLAAAVLANDHIDRFLA